MKKWLFATPLLWGFFLFSHAFSAQAAKTLSSSLPQRLICLSPPQVTSQMDKRILAIRVAFLPDSLATTTGDGTFNSGIPDTVKVDPLPHDRLYFEDHLRFLDNYFTSASGGAASIDTFAVFPAALDSAYHLPHQMWHYNHNTTPEDLNWRLANLFLDAWSAAAADTAIHPEDFDTFIIFHAGVGKDFELGFDETPHDIPSAYFTLTDLQESLDSSAFNGVMVQGVEISSGLLLPECEYQPEVNAEIAMNGTEALLFGHSLGLPALYNTENGRSGVGRFDLMDQGSGNFAGMVPCRPSAWSRVFMGWEQPVLLHPTADSDTFWVNLTGVTNPLHPSAAQIYRINLNESEYLLIENRNYDPDSLTYTIAYDRDKRRLKIFENYNYDPQILDGAFGVIDSIANYDFGIPGRGLLIWHVDETVIEANYAQNRVNADPNHRGVALIEGDAAEDIGQSYGFFDVGYGTELGWSRDFFFAGNEEFLAANPELNSVILSDDSRPNLRGYDDSPTGVRIGGFNTPQNTMRFWVSNSWSQSGFPLKLASASGGLCPSAIDLNGDGKTDWIFTVTPEGAVQAFDSLGRAQGVAIESHWEADLLGDSALVHDTLLVRLDSITATPAFLGEHGALPAIIPTANASANIVGYSVPPEFSTIVQVPLDTTAHCSPLVSRPEPDNSWYIGDDAGNLYGFDNATLRWKVSPFDGERIVGLCLSDSGSDSPIFMATAAGGAALVAQDSVVQWTKRLPFGIDFPPIAILQEKYSRWDLVVVGDGGEVALLDPLSGNLRAGFPFDCGMTIGAAPAAADLDNDGRIEIVLCGNNRIAAVAENGVLAANWPLVLDARRPYQDIVSPPAISELDDSELRVFFGWPGGSIDARDRWGRMTPGFSRTTADMVHSAPFFVQLDDDPESELVALDENGGLYIWHLAQLGNFADQRRPWNGWQNGNFRQGWVVDPTPLSLPDHSVLVKAKVYPWPNPAPNSASDVSHIRYLMGQAGRITVRIFDGSGDLVKELSAATEADVESDLDWDLTDVTSGIYLGRVEAEAGGKTEVTFIKIAVVK